MIIKMPNGRFRVFLVKKNEKGEVTARLHVGDFDDETQSKQEWQAAHMKSNDNVMGEVPEIQIGELPEPEMLALAMICFRETVQMQGANMEAKQAGKKIPFTETETTKSHQVLYAALQQKGVLI